jgi:DNA-binding transcriptional regulator YiaG
MATDLFSIATARRACRSGDGRVLRERNDLSLREAADYLGVSESTLSNWERGRAIPRRRDLATRYADFLSRLLAAVAQQ